MPRVRFVGGPHSGAEMFSTEESLPPIYVEFRDYGSGFRYILRRGVYVYDGEIPVQ